MKTRKYDVVLFDLDGTLTDSGPGIMRCAGIALREMGIAYDSEQQLRAFVGPPLSVSFSRFGVAPEKVEEAITVYRKYYHDTGKWENFPYPGIENVLRQLKDAGCRLLVATSKPEALSREIMKRFGLDIWFEDICGASLDHSRENKDDVLRYLIEKTGCKEQMVLVGDTIYDVEGASRVGIPAIGVAWGYGDPAQMKKAGAVDVAADMDGLLELLLTD